VQQDHQLIDSGKLPAEVGTRDIDYLTSDALRGRGTFSPGLDSAAHSFCAG
jgi:hypothetical protein